MDTATPGIYEVHYEIGTRPGMEATKTEPTAENEDTDDETAEGEPAVSLSAGQYGQTWLTVIVQEVAA